MGKLERPIKNVPDRVKPYEFRGRGDYGGKVSTPQEWKAAFDAAPACHHLQHTEVYRQKVEKKLQDDVTKGVKELEATLGIEDALLHADPSVTLQLEEDNIVRAQAARGISDIEQFLQEPPKSQ